MKFRITRTSDWKDTHPFDGAYPEERTDKFGKQQQIWCVDINTIEELMELQEKVNHPLIVDVFNSFHLEKDEPYLEIYDDYRE